MLYGEKRKVSWSRTKLFFLPFPFSFKKKTFCSFFVKMMTKFNQELYDCIKVKKNEPLSSIGQRRVRVVEKEVAEKGSSTPVPEEGQTASWLFLLRRLPSSEEVSDGGQEEGEG